MEADNVEGLFKALELIADGSGGNREEIYDI